MDGTNIASPPPTDTREDVQPGSPPDPSSADSIGGKPGLTERQRHAKMVRDAVIPALMQTAIAPRGTIDGKTVRGYRDELLREMGDPADALERMLIEQAALAHVMVMQLHASTALEKTAEGAGIYATAAARLMAELRRTILAVREYRTPPIRPLVTKIEQQNVAHTQAVSYAASADAASMSYREENRHDSKQGSKPAESADGEQYDDLEVPGARRRWAAEPATSGTAH